MSINTLDRGIVEQIVREVVLKRIGARPPNAASTLAVHASARHMHVSREHLDILYGPGHELTPDRPLYQAGNYAAKETVTLIGPRSRVISNLRILGPCRDLNQVELALTDSIALGFDVPIRASGNIAGTPGCMLMGPAGFFEMKEGVIRAAPHVHMHPDDATFHGVKAGEYMKLRVGGPCGLAFERMLVRVHADFKLEVHIDTDEGNACALQANTPVELAK